MKRVCGALFLLLTLAAPAQAAESIQSVLVYQGLAEVTREAAVAPGQSVVEFRNLPDTLLDDSLVASGARVVDLTLEVKPLADSSRAAEAALQAKKKTLEFSVREQQDAIGVANRQDETVKAWLAALAGNQKPIAPLAASARDVSTLAAQAAKTRRDAERAIESLKDQIAAVDAELAKVGSGARAERTARVRIEPGSGTRLRLGYRVGGADWSPSYEAHLQSQGAAKLHLDLYASISNRTGEDWPNTRLSVQTGQPNQQTQPPPAYPVVIHYFEPMRRAYGAMAKESRDEAFNAATPAMALAAAPAPEPQLRQTAFSASWTLPDLRSIPNGNDPARVALESTDVDSDVVLRTVPRQDPHAYVLARFAPPDLRLAAGEPVALFLDEAFAGKAALPAPGADGKTELGFGPDPLLDVSYVAAPRRAEDGRTLGLGKTRELHDAATLKLRSRHSAPYAVEWIEVAPTSAEESIKVELSGDLQKAQADWNGVKGAYRTAFTLKPNEARSFGYQTVVTYPADRQIDW